MPSSIQGFGTAFVGQRDFWPDGSYVTTEWIVVLFLPLIPLRSVRVKASPMRVRTLYVAASTHRDYVICDERRPHLKQVACVYGFAIFYAAWIFGLAVSLHSFAARVSDTVGIAVLLLIVGLPWLLPWYLRERAKHWRPGLK
jgi:hypothetical protein